MTETTEGNGADRPCAQTNTERSRRFRARRRQQKHQVLQHDLNRLFVDMAGEIVRSPYSVDERAALLSWTALAFMCRKDAITEGG
jgi:hypothetical protein